jgi:hypothetical protein
MGLTALTHGQILTPAALALFNRTAATKTAGDADHPVIMHADPAQDPSDRVPETTFLT